MSNRNEVAALYRFVIEDVIRNIRREFVNMGVDEQVLHELQTGWERRLLDSGIFTPPATTAAATRMVPGSAAAAMYYYSQQQQQLQLQQQQQVGISAVTMNAQNNSNSITPLEKTKRHEDSDPDALNSDLDSSSSEEGGEGGGKTAALKADTEEASNENILLCLYEKVNRTRNKYRCVFKEGILHLDGQEYCLNKINCEFEW
jgi:transcription initiation factor TFIIA large subunit